MSNISSYEMKMLEAFVQNEKSLSFYANAYNVMKSGDSLNLKFFWSWWAFLGNSMFLLYRKLYIPFLIFFVIEFFIPFVAFFIWAVIGGIGPYLVLKSFIEKKQQIESNLEDEEQRIQAMHNISGVHKWVIALVIIKWVLIMLLLSPYIAYIVRIGGV